MKNCVDRESYSLAAGLALGLIILGAGNRTDIPESIPDTLHYYMVGGHTRPFSGAQKDKYKSPRYIKVLYNVFLLFIRMFARNITAIKLYQK